MSIRELPTLLQLVRESLVREESLLISALEDLPSDLFPGLLEEAFTTRKTKMLRMIVAAWPFTYLPVGVLMEFKDLEILRAVLDGLDVLLTHKNHPRRWKLQVVNFCSVHHDFRRVWTGEDDDGGRCSPQVMSKKQPVFREGKYLEVLTDVCVKTENVEEYQACLLEWARRRNGSLQLCCQRLQVLSIPFDSILQHLQTFELKSFQEVKIDMFWISCIESSAEMRNESSDFNGVRRAFPHSLQSPSGLREDSIHWVTSLFSKFTSLEHLHLNLNNLWNRLEIVFWHLPNPLKALSINKCRISAKDMILLTLCPHVHQLKHLNFNEAIFCLMEFPLLRVLLVKVSDTLQTLELEHCKLTDGELYKLLPALGLCSQLTKVNFYDNVFSTSFLRVLLSHMAGLSLLAKEMYPAPVECYVNFSENFSKICGELTDSCKIKKPHRLVLFGAHACFRCQERYVYNVTVRPCLCRR